MPIQELQNPAEKDPKPPYKKQSQPWPGLASAIEGLGGLDIIVSNAGRQQTRASILDVSSKDFNVTMKTNIYVPFWIIEAALPHLKPGSVVIRTASEQAYDPSPGFV